MVMHRSSGFIEPCPYEAELSPTGSDAAAHPYSCPRVCSARHCRAVIGYFKSELPKSQIYLECLPLFARGLVRLPNHPRLDPEVVAVLLMQQADPAIGRRDADQHAARGGQWPSDVAIRLSRMRVITSLALPAANGT
jgi:hypothetical protein